MGWEHSGYASKLSDAFFNILGLDQFIHRHKSGFEETVRLRHCPKGLLEIEMQILKNLHCLLISAWWLYI